MFAKAAEEPRRVRLTDCVCVQLQGNVLAEQEAQDQERDDVGEEDPRGVRQTGPHQVRLRARLMLAAGDPTLTSAVVSPERLSYPEVVTGLFFILMTLLWFTREPGFVPGWTSLFEK